MNAESAGAPDRAHLHPHRAKDKLEHVNIQFRMNIYIIYLWYKLHNICGLINLIHTPRDPAWNPRPRPTER